MKKETNTKAHTIAWVCEQLGVSRWTILRLVKAGDLVKIKVGKKAVRITDASFQAYFTRQQAEQGAV